jgi:hypothetical protein
MLRIDLHLAKKTYKDTCLGMQAKAGYANTNYAYSYFKPFARVEKKGGTICGQICILNDQPQSYALI